MKSALVTSATSGPVTVCITQQVVPGREMSFEAWLRGVSQAAQQFPGHQGIEILRPSGHGSNYTYIFRFDSFAHLQAWENSIEKEQWVSKLRGLVQTPAKKDILTGLEYWFTLPGDPTRPAPPRYKMALVTIVAIYPLTTLLAMVLSNLFGSSLTPLLKGFMVSIAAVLLMTYVIMPRLIRLFSKWLFKQSSS